MKKRDLLYLVIIIILSMFITKNSNEIEQCHSQVTVLSKIIHQNDSLLLEEMRINNELFDIIKRNGLDNISR